MTKKAAAVVEADLTMIAESLRPLAVDILDLAENPENARQHDEADLLVIGNSLRTYGQLKPVIARREHRGMANVVLAGNGTLQAAKSIGWAHLAVAWFEGTDEQAEEFALVDNRSAELSQWNYKTLSGQLKGIAARDGEAKLTFLGWRDSEYGPLLQTDWSQGDLKEPTDERHTGQHHVTLTIEQYEVVGAAIAKVRKAQDDESMSEGRCTELICADFLAGR